MNSSPIPLPREKIITQLLHFFSIEESSSFFDTPTFSSHENYNNKRNPMSSNLDASTEFGGKPRATRDDVCESELSKPSNGVIDENIESSASTAGILATKFRSFSPLHNKCTYNIDQVKGRIRGGFFREEKRHLEIIQRKNVDICGLALIVTDFSSQKIMKYNTW